MPGPAGEVGEGEGMPQTYRPEFLRRFLHWLDGERWCLTCQSWTPLAHRDGHPLPAAGKRSMKRRYDDSTGGQINRRRS